MSYTATETCAFLKITSAPAPPKVTRTPESNSLRVTTLAPRWFMDSNKRRVFWGRLLGSRSRHWLMVRSQLGSSPLTYLLGLGGFSYSRREAISIGLVPENGGRPVTISNMM